MCVLECVILHECECVNECEYARVCLCDCA